MFEHTVVCTVFSLLNSNRVSFVFVVVIVLHGLCNGLLTLSTAAVGKVVSFAIKILP